MRYSEDSLEQLACSDGVGRTLHIWQAPEPQLVILAIHGGMAHAGDYIVPALYFKQHKAATVSLDMVGHANGKRVDIPNFDQFLQDTALLLQWVKSRYAGLPIVVMGHSMGGLIAAHLAFGRFAHEPLIKGYVLSSPYFVNAIPVPKILEKFSGVWARFFPTAKVPVKSFSHVLTHDANIAARIVQDQQDGIRGTEPSFRFANALMQAQKDLPTDFSRWNRPVFAAIAGQDFLADSQASERLLSSIPVHLRTIEVYAQNYHENFNELNRDEIFASVWAWMRQLLA